MGRMPHRRKPGESSGPPLRACRMSRAPSARRKGPAKVTTGRKRWSGKGEDSANPARPGGPPQRARGIKGEHLANFYSILVKFPSNTRSLPLPGPPDLLQSGYRGEGDQATKRGHGVLELTFVTQLSDPSRGALEKEGSFCWGDPAIEWVDRELGRGDVF